MAMPTTAVNSGNPAAASEPKVMISTTNATEMPMTSDVALTATGSIMPGPRASTSMPISRPASIAASSASRFSVVISAGAATSKTNSAVPMRPSSESTRTE